ncbi:MAG: Zn-dependent hydrolase [Rhodospirillaceae bacterium]|nr:Zn-dependent hydrolase [Rhodospirillaceae bacterium]
MIEIDAARLLADLGALRRFGAVGTGVVRPAFSAEDMAARRWLQARMQAAGLDATIDGVGNVLGRSRRSGPALLIGSHSDTQPTGGWLDGAMGVIHGLEIARSLAENPATAGLAVDVASWSDEEGTFAGFLGSRSFCGEDVAPLIAGAANADGKRLSDVLRETGLAGLPRGSLEKGRHVAYLETHIEQGGRLETAGKAIGIVTGIVGIREYRIDFHGARNHAGTTPMSIRRDAGAALIRFAHNLDEEFAGLADADTVWTIGRVALEPGALSVIPGTASLWLQFRDGDPARLRSMVHALEGLVAAHDREGRVMVRLTEHDLPSAPVAMDSGLQEHLVAAAERVAPRQWLRMPSGAGHDAQILAPHLPAAMLFVPSIGGLSHDSGEDTDPADIVLGCRVAATAVAAILRER